AGRVEPQAARVSAHDLEAIVAGGLHVDEVGRLRQHALHPLTVAIGEMPLGIMADQDEMTVHVLSLPHFCVTAVQIVSRTLQPDSFASQARIPPKSGGVTRAEFERPWCKKPLSKRSPRGIIPAR